MDYTQNSRGTGIPYPQSQVNFSETRNTRMNKNEIEVPVDDFQFCLSHSNKIRPKDIRRLDLNELIKLLLF